MVWLFFLAYGDTMLSDVKILKTYEDPAEVSDDYLARPYSMDFGADGKLYLLDMFKSMVFIWNKDGSYLKSFGGPGEGPGEMSSPARIAVTDSEIWVWEQRRRMSVFSLRGDFKRTVHVPQLFPRHFAVLGEGAVLTGTREFHDDGTMDMAFKMLDAKGQVHKRVKSYPSQAFLAKISGKDGNKTTLKAFAGEMDIQRAPSGDWYLGFSRDRKIYRVNAAGELSDPHRFELPVSKPNGRDRELVMGMSVPTADGSRLAIKDVPDLKVDFSHEKALYTHFLIRGDRVAFVLTPIGSTGGSGNGWNWATYFVCDFNTGAVLNHGRYHFREDTVVFYRNGHILAAMIDEDDEYQIAEISLKGL